MNEPEYPFQLQEDITLKSLKQRESKIQDSLATFEVMQDLIKHHRGDTSKISGILKRKDVDQVVCLLQDQLRMTRRALEGSSKFFNQLKKVSSLESLEIEKEEGT